MARRTLKDYLETEAVGESMDPSRFESDRFAWFVEVTAKAFEYKQVMLALGYGEAPLDVERKDGRFVLTLDAPSATDRCWEVVFDTTMTSAEFMEELDDLESELGVMKSELEAQVKRQVARSSALAKLTLAERELLGL